MAKSPGGTVACATANPVRLTEAMGEVAAELHRMSQPMTALLCSLEIGTMTGTVEGYRDAVRESLVQCERLMQSIAAMRAAITEGLEQP